MKTRTRILTVLTVGLIALTAMCYGFASWSTDITLEGNVSANGKWDVTVTAADVEVSSTGAAVDNEDVSLTYHSYDDDGVVYNNSYASKNAMNAKIAELEEAGCTITSSTCNQYIFQVTISYYDADNIFTTETVGIYATKEEADAASDARKAEIEASGGSINSRKRSSVWYCTVEYTRPGGTVISDTSVTYAPVCFTLPKAWANYSVTITNNGTVNANLSNYSFDFTELDDTVYSVSVPTGFEDEVLAPGESCTFNFVVQVKETDATELTAEAEGFTITLNYVQDTVEEAPEAGHSNGSN